MVELLAPVGDFDSLYAAVENGANAVYLGGEVFSARKYAKNFTNMEIKEAVQYCHLNNVEVHVAVNILLDDSEMDEAVDYIKYLYDINVDGIIVQDLGLASIVLDLFEDLPLHASTQMTINNLEGARLIEKIGFKRVVLARETPFEEIKRIVEETNLEVEVFVHGALCVAYSGQCLMSSLIGGRSGNRGSCAQPCRMAYSIVDHNGKERSELREKHILSTRDLNTLEDIEKLIDIGVDSFKIEGRMKRPEYVATIVSKYRKVIDEGVKKLTREDLDEVKQIFNRDFTRGLTFKDFGNSFISYDRPDNRGLLLGEVLGEDKNNNILIKLFRDLDCEDGIEFDLGDEYRGMKSNINGFKGEIIKYPKLGDVKKGSKVYKTSDTRLLEKARQSYEEKSSKAINMLLETKIGQTPKLKIQYGDILVLVDNDFKCQEAKKVSLDYDTCYKQLSKLGDTNFKLDQLGLDIDKNSFLPLSVLNELRRDGIEILNQKISTLSRVEILEYEKNKKKAMELDSQPSLDRNMICSRVSDYKQFLQIDLEKIDRIYIGYRNNIEETLDRLSNYRNIEKYIWTGKILERDHMEKLEVFLDDYKDHFDGICISNLGALSLVLNSYDLKIHGDIGLNIFNSYSLNFFRNLGLDSLTLSLELTLSQIEKISCKMGGNIEIYGYGYLPSMLMKTCPMALIKSCNYDEDCKSCKFKSGYGLKDRLNKVFYFDRKDDITTLYNAMPLMVIDNIDRILKNNNYLIRMDYTIEDDISELQDIYYDYINRNIARGQMLDFVEEKSKGMEITNGHYFRGIM